MDCFGSLWVGCSWVWVVVGRCALFLTLVCMPILATLRKEEPDILQDRLLLHDSHLLAMS